MRKVTRILLMVTTMILVITSTPLSASAVSRKDGTLKGSTILITTSTYAYKSGGQRVAVIPKGTKVTAISESGKFIWITYKKKTLYIDSTYVLINIKQYIPTLDIRLDMAKKNNLFNMADEKIPNVSNKRFYTSKGSKKGTSAWLRYSVAKKLLSAQSSFRKDGYSIVIYDAYRPYSVTTSIRDGFKKWLNTKTWSFKNYWFGSLGESWFLAQNASAHNYGRAIDMSLKSIKTGKLLDMPSKMHTLDKRAAYYTWANSTSTSAKNARYLKSKMESFGFTYLQSEWWHFQVNSIPYGSVLDLKI